MGFSKEETSRTAAAPPRGFNFMPSAMGDKLLRTLNRSVENIVAARGARLPCVKGGVSHSADEGIVKA